MSPLRRYITVVSLAGLTVLATWVWLGRSALLSPADPMMWVFMAALVAGECLPMRVINDGSEGEITTSSTFAMALLLIGGAPVALAGIALGTVTSDVLRRKPADRTVFNVAQYGLSVAASAGVLALLTGTPLSAAHELTPALLPAFGAAAAAFFFTNSGLVARAVSYAEGVEFWGYLRRDVGLQTSTVGILLGLAPIVIITNEFSPAALPLLGLPLFAVHRAGRQVILNQRQALHDALTELPNRTLLQDRLEQAIRLAERSSHDVAVLFIDLDRFKEINDTLGHNHGDRLLQEVARRLRGAVRDGDTVARLGGDEFAVVLPEVRGELGVQRVVTELQAALEPPIASSGVELQVGASIGVALFPHHGLDAGTLMRQADVAMYRAKRGGIGHLIYAPWQDEGSAERLQLVAELRHGIEAGELVAHFQPKANLTTGTISGVEVLIRWQHPTRGLLYPDEFIPVAEQHGLMRRLTTQVLELAMGQQRAWRRQGIVLDVAVNVASADLLDGRFPLELAELLERFETLPGTLQLEITENIVMANPERTLDVLARLGELGITFALDDFGTGYSSLAQLKRLPVTELKIDKSFVLDMIDSSDDAAIVRSTIELARSLGLHVVAEGVESAEHWRRLADYGGDTAQGFYLSRPLPADELVAWLAGDARSLAPSAA